MKTFLASIGLVFAAVLALVTASDSSFADDEPSPDELHITGLTYGGSGCPRGTVGVDIAPDGTAFTLIFDAFLAQIGPGVPLPESRKNCQVNFTVHVPHGFTYAITSVDYRGFANLAAGAQGLQKSTYYFQGQAPQASTWTPFSGPMLEDWHLRDEIDVAALVWAPCGETRSLNINAQLRVNKGTASASSSSFMAMDSEDGNIEQIYHVAWAACPTP